MGWLFMRSLGGYSGPRQYLDARFTFETPNAVSRVLKSALVRLRVYYAAVEHINKATEERNVWALICLVYYNRRDREGFVFGYKDMSESMGPREAECPEEILDLLTETDSEYARDWRRQCRDNITARRAMASKPIPRPGQTIVFDEPVQFANGRSFTSMRVVANRSARSPAVLFLDPSSGEYYRIRDIKKRNYRLVQAEAQAEMF